MLMCMAAAQCPVLIIVCCMPQAAIFALFGATVTSWMVLAQPCVQL